MYIIIILCSFLTEEHITLSLSANEYLDHVTENAALKISLVARVLETEHVITLKDDFRLRIPDLQLEVSAVYLFAKQMGKSFHNKMVKMRKNNV